MALHWNVSKVTKPDLWIKAVETEMGGYRKPTPEDKPEDVKEILNGTTHAMIFALMRVGQRSITEKNWREVYARMRLIELSEGGKTGYFGTSGKVTPQIVREHIGLSTNVSDESRASFMKRVFNAEFERTIDREVKE